MVLITTSQLSSILFCFTFLAFLLFCFYLRFLLFGFEHVPLNSWEHFPCSSVNWLLEFPSLSCVEGQLLPINFQRTCKTFAVKRFYFVINKTYTWYDLHSLLNVIVDSDIITSIGTEVYHLGIKEWTSSRTAPAAAGFRSLFIIDFIWLSISSICCIKWYSSLLVPWNSFTNFL